MIPHELKLYLLAVVALDSLDHTNANKSIKKAFRSIERFARESCEEMEKDPLLSIGHERAVHNFTTVIDAIDAETLELPIGELRVMK